MLRIQIFLFIVHNLVGFSQQDFQIRIINCYFDLNFPASSSDILDIDSEDGGIAIYKKKLKPYFRLNSSHFKMDTHSTKSLISKKFMFDHRVLILNSNTNFMVYFDCTGKMKINNIIYFPDKRLMKNICRDRAIKKMCDFCKN